MARAKKCDRCGKLHEHYDGGREFKNSEKANGVILIDRDWITNTGLANPTTFARTA